MTRVLYIGDSSLASTSRHRAEAFRRVGCDLDMADPYRDLASVLHGKLRSKLHFHTGYQLVQARAVEWCWNVMTISPKPDLIWVNSGELFGPDCIKVLKSGSAPVVLYNNDDITGHRDGRRFDSIRKALPLFDLCVVCRDVNVEEYRHAGSRDVIRVTMSYDEVEHAPFSSPDVIPANFRSDVAFIGTWMRHEGRDRFLMELIEFGVPIAIWGARWEKSPYWRQLRPFYRGGNLSGRDYVAAIQGAKVCLGMLSKGNRDLHTSRSVEIPYANGVLCAERTPEHIQMYNEGEEAIFWGGSRECADRCLELLRNDALRERIRVSGRERVVELRVGNEDKCRSVMSHVLRGG